MIKRLLFTFLDLFYKKRAKQRTCILIIGGSLRAADTYRQDLFPYGVPNYMKVAIASPDTYLKQTSQLVFTSVLILPTTIIDLHLEKRILGDLRTNLQIVAKIVDHSRTFNHKV